MTESVLRKRNYEAKGTKLTPHWDFGKLIYLSGYFSFDIKIQVVPHLPPKMLQVIGSTTSQAQSVLRKLLLLVLANCLSQCSIAGKRHYDHGNSYKETI